MDATPVFSLAWIVILGAIAVGVLFAIAAVTGALSSRRPGEHGQLVKAHGSAATMGILGFICVAFMLLGGLFVARRSVVPNESQIAMPTAIDEATPPIEQPRLIEQPMMSTDAPVLSTEVPAQVTPTSVAVAQTELDGASAEAPDAAGAAEEPVENAAATESDADSASATSSPAADRHATTDRPRPEGRIDHGSSEPPMEIFTTKALPEWTGRSLKELTDGMVPQVEIVAQSDLHASIQTAHQEAVERSLKTLTDRVTTTDSRFANAQLPYRAFRDHSLREWCVEKQMHEFAGREEPMYRVFVKYEDSASIREQLLEVHKDAVVDHRAKDISIGVGVLALGLGGLSGFLRLLLGATGRRRALILAGGGLALTVAVFAFVVA